MARNIFDDLLPSSHVLDAFVATHVLGWQGVRWQPTDNVSLGICPGGTAETSVPRFTEREDLVASVQAALHGLGHSVETTPVPEGWRVQVDAEAVTMRRLPQALCAAAWRVLHREGE